MDEWTFHCKILSVLPNATKAEMKKAYRELAKLLHPDRHGGSDLAKKKFQELSESYDYLCRNLAPKPTESNPSQRSRPSPKSSEPTPKSTTSNSTRQTRYRTPSWQSLKSFGAMFVVIVLSFAADVHFSGNASNKRPYFSKVVRGPTRQIASQCSMTIESDPRGADILINGDLKGTTPSTLLLGCGRDFEVTLKREGFYSDLSNVLVNAASSKFYKMLLSIPMGKVELTINPGMRIEIADSEFSKYVRAGETITIPLRANIRHHVRFHNEVLGIDATRDIKVTEGALTKETLRFNPGEVHVFHH